MRSYFKVKSATGFFTKLHLKLALVTGTIVLTLWPLFESLPHTLFKSDVNLITYSNHFYENKDGNDDPTIDLLFKDLKCESSGSRAEKQEKIWQQITHFLNDSHVFDRFSNCDKYFTIMLQTSGYSTINEMVAEFERRDLHPNFTIAFSHAVHHQAGIFELFMALFYRPKNLHCIHVDIKVKGIYDILFAS